MDAPGGTPQETHRREAAPNEKATSGERLGLVPIHAGRLVDEVAKQLFAAIVAGRIRLGERLSEAAIARELAMSRGPIREAQRLLERRGLLVFKPRHGFFVREMTPAQIMDLFGLRRVLERYAIEQAVARADDAALHELALWCQRLLAMDMNGNGRPISADTLVEEDIAIHRLICTLSANASLQAVYEYTLTEMRLALSLINLGFRSPTRIVESHRTLIDALLARDAATAVAEMERHLDYSRMRMMERIPETAAG